MTITSRPESARRTGKREQILVAAAPIFGELGYERASIDAIAASAGVSKPTVYSHFGDKPGLFRESVADSAARLNAGALQAIGSFRQGDEDWLDGLHELGWALTQCQRADCNRYLGRMIAAESGRDPELWRWVWERSGGPITDALAGRLAMLSNAGRLRIADPSMAAHQFFALIDAEFPLLTDGGAVDPPERRLRAAVREGVDTFVRAYAARTNDTRVVPA